ncbi:MAG: response regulator [Nitrospinota bacterium]|nr:response regulator [Nitrospinota bacterium]
MSPAEIDFKNLSALVVDDYEAIRSKLTSALNALGIKTTEAVNGVNALEVLAKESFDMMFTDIVMPEMDGFELCEEVRRKPELRKMPVVVTSTHADTNYIIKALRLGADDYLAKPIDKELLQKVVQRIMLPSMDEEENG